MRAEELREKLGITPQGQAARKSDTVLFHLAFRLDKKTAEKFIKTAAGYYQSESLYARQAIVEKLDKEKVENENQG